MALSYQGVSAECHQDKPDCAAVAKRPRNLSELMSVGYMMYFMQIPVAQSLIVLVINSWRQILGLMLRLRDAELPFRLHLMGMEYRDHLTPYTTCSVSNTCVREPFYSSRFKHKDRVSSRHAKNDSREERWATTTKV